MRRHKASCTVADAERLIGQLAGVQRSEGSRWFTFRVAAHTFGYLWPDTGTLGLKQEVAEQLALVAERPDVFEVQFTAGGFGWVVIRLDRIGSDELAELIFEAWRLTAPASLLAARGDRLPR